MILGKETGTVYIAKKNMALLLPKRMCQPFIQPYWVSDSQRSEHPSPSKGTARVVYWLL